jgi:hypothetical protein
MIGRKNIAITISIDTWTINFARPERELPTTSGETPSSISIDFAHWSSCSVSTPCSRSFAGLAVSSASDEIEAADAGAKRVYQQLSHPI